MQPLIDEYYCDVPGYEDYYQISNFGNVRSVDRRVVGRSGLLKSKIIRGSISNGYLGVNLFKNNKYKRFLVHRLVALIFVNNKYGKPEVNHLDGDKLNNHYSNLEWVTRQENAQHSVSVLNKNVGDSSGTAILTAEQVKEIKLLLGTAKMKLQEIGDLFGVSNHVIHKIKRGKNWAWLDEKGLFTSCNH